MAKLIPLTQGKFATVDDNVYEWAMQWEWYAKWNGYSWYAVRSKGTKPNQKTIYLHREIMKAPDGVDVDHQDRDSLNDRNENLRLATHAQNQQNRGPYANNASGYKGVSWFARDGKWQANIKVDNKQIYLGLFDDPAEAAAVYDSAARKYHGEFAYQNLPQGDINGND